MKSVSDREPAIDKLIDRWVAERGWTRDEAFGVLRRASQRANVKVAAIARALVARGSDS
jgi:hypothetical protein